MGEADLGVQHKGHRNFIMGAARDTKNADALKKVSLGFLNSGVNLHAVHGGYKYGVFVWARSRDRRAHARLWLGHLRKFCGQRDFGANVKSMGKWDTFICMLSYNLTIYILFKESDWFIYKIGWAFDIIPKLYFLQENSRSSYGFKFMAVLRHKYIPDWLGLALTRPEAHGPKDV